MQTPRTPDDLGASKCRALEGGVMEGVYLISLYHHIPFYHFLVFPISLRSFPTSRDVFPPCAIFRRPSRPSQIIAGGRTASHGFARLSHSGLPIMGGLVLYMVTCIYTLRADQGSLESISKDFPCVRYVVL